MILNNPLDWACGECAQQPNENCIGLPKGEFHAVRVEAADIHSRRNNGTIITKDEFYQAALDSNLF